MVKSMARTPKIVEDRREQIIDAAMRAFAQKGFTRATNKDIAREAGITPGLIYYYFESKEALLNAIIETRSPIRLMTSLPQHMLTMPPQLFMRYMIQQVLDIVESENFIGLIRVILPEVVHGDNPEMSSLVGAALLRVMGFIGNFLEAKMQSGELRHTEVSVTTQIIFGSVAGFVLRRQIFRDPVALEYSHEQIADSVIETILKGLLPR
jgi:AcrR family transcriptional regulator